MPTTHTIGLIMNGVTGRMGANQHLKRSICAIMKQGGAPLPDGSRIMPSPVLVGRNPAKLAELARETGLEKWTTDLDAALADPAYQVYFDAQTTSLRAAAVKKAIAARKHIYCEKPSATTTAAAYELYQLAKRAGLKNGVVQDKLWLPGLVKLRELIERGFFGRILSVRGEFGYWVFEGDRQPRCPHPGAPGRAGMGQLPQRPSWNYRKEDGGGIIIDMLCHWRYILDNLFGRVRAVSCLGATHIGERWDERGQPYSATADDAAYATFELDPADADQAGPIVAQFNSSWCVRVRRDDLLVMQVDGTAGSAVATLRDCYTQPYDATPRAVWNPDEPNPVDFYAAWTRVADRPPSAPGDRPAQDEPPVRAAPPYDNAFKVQWELFLRHVVADEPFRWTLLEGAKGVQLAELGLESWRERRWLNVPELEP